MKVKELIKNLQELPQDADAFYLYDGFCTCEVEGAYLANSGEVIIMDSQVVYHDYSRPVGSPTEKDEPYFYPYHK